MCFSRLIGWLFRCACLLCVWASGLHCVWVLVAMHDFFGFCGFGGGMVVICGFCWDLLLGGFVFAVVI